MQTHITWCVIRVQSVPVNLRRNGHSWSDWKEKVGISSESELHSSSSDISITNVHHNRTSWRKEWTIVRVGCGVTPDLCSWNAPGISDVHIQWIQSLCAELHNTHFNNPYKLTASELYIQVHSLHPESLVCPPHCWCWDQCLVWWWSFPQTLDLMMVPLLSQSVPLQ